MVVTHGNGPQVGFILRRSELAVQEVHTAPLDIIGADTQGSIGYMDPTETVASEFPDIDFVHISGYKANGWHRTFPASVTSPWGSY